MENIKIEKLKKRGVVHPLTLFINLMEFFEVSECKKTDDNCSYENYSFIIYKNKPKEEFIEAAKVIKKYSRQTTFELSSQMAEIIYSISKNGNESLIIKSYRYTNVSIYDDHIYYGQENKQIEYHFYDNGIVWNYTNNKKPFPCSMKDIFYYNKETNIEYNIFLCILNSWSEKYIIWKDLMKDFEIHSAYSSIPLSLIHSCQNRRSLIEAYYKKGQKRNNKENIGCGIFLAKINSIVEQKDIQKLYGYDVPTCFIDRSKKSLAYPLSAIIFKKMVEQNIPLSIKEKDFLLTRGFIEDAIEMSILLRRKVPIKITTANSIKEWHDRLLTLQRNKEYPLMKIPKQSVFNNIKFPAEFKRLSIRKQMVEEGVFQHNCVASYIYDVNDDRCSIWSLRKKDGTRITIEIRIKKNKYYISQMFGFGNSQISDSDKSYIIENLKKCSYK